MAKVENKMVVDNTTVRFFHKRSDAINDGNLRVKTTSQKHADIYCYHEGNGVGYLVENRVTDEYYDVAGKVPENVIEVLKQGVMKR